MNLKNPGIRATINHAEMFGGKAKKQIRFFYSF